MKIKIKFTCMGKYCSNGGGDDEDGGGGEDEDVVGDSQDTNKTIKTKLDVIKSDHGYSY